MNALALATVWPCSNSRSTMKALSTNTTPSSVCHRRTGACSCPQGEGVPSCSWLCWWSCGLKREVTCIIFKKYKVQSPRSKVEKTGDAEEPLELRTLEAGLWTQ